jgi:hypothetical protein
MSGTLCVHAILPAQRCSPAPSKSRHSTELAEDGLPPLRTAGDFGAVLRGLAAFAATRLAAAFFATFADLRFDQSTLRKFIISRSAGRARGCWRRRCGGQNSRPTRR